MDPYGLWHSRPAARYSALVSRRAACAVLSLVAAALVAYYAWAPDLFGGKAQGDGYFSFHYLPGLVVHHSLDLRQVLPADLDAMDTGPRGHKLNRAPIGPALAMLPIYCLGETGKLLAVGVVRAVGGNAGLLGPPPFVPHTGQMFYTGLVTLGAGLWGMLLVYRLLRRYFARAAALVGALAAVGLTPQLWYLTVQPHYQHGLAFAAVALLLWQWDLGRGELGLRRFFGLGVLGGVAMLMRAQEVVFLLAPGLELAGAAGGAIYQRWQGQQPGRRAGRLLGCAALLGVGALVGFLPQLVVWGQYFGWFVRPGNIERLRPLEPALGEVLWSMRAGLFTWTPVAYVGVWGLALGLIGAWRQPAHAAEEGERARLRGLLLAALIILLADVYLVAASWVWYGGFSFGARRLSDCAGLFGLGVAVLWQGAQRGLPRGSARLARGALAGTLLGLLVLNATLVELVRQRRLPDSGATAQAAYRLVQRAGGPGWLVRLLRYGYPFAQPAGWLFALRHQAPLTAWEDVVGSYALEREAHDLSLSGDTWDFTQPTADRFVIAGLLPLPADSHGQPVGPRVRVLLQPFAHEPIEATLEGELPAGAEVQWNGQTLATRREEAAMHFTLPAAQVTAHAVGELTLLVPTPPGAPPPRLRQLRLVSTTRWW